ncbi:YhdP family protein [Aeromonas sp. R6-2]|uniref:YhdP family protein n=1 Tax=unclassified Aeromonas TaxID=257493 RepID=UPI0034A56F11
MLHRWLSRAWLALGVLFVLLAIGISAVRLGGPLLNQHKEALVTRLLGPGARVESLGLTWVGRGPALSLEGLRLDAPDSPFGFTLSRASLSLDLWRSLRSAAPHFRDLQLHGLDLTLDLTRPQQNSREQQQRIDPLLEVVLGSFRRFSLHDSRLRLKTPLGELTTLSIAELGWQNRGNRHQGVGKAYLVDGIGESTLDLIIDLKGRSHRLDDLSGRLYLGAHRLNITPLLARIHAGEPRLEGQLDLQLWSEFQGREWGESLLKFGNNYLIWKDKGQMHRLGLSGGQIQLRRDEQDWQLASYDVQLKLDERPWLRSQLQLERKGDQILGYAPRVELGKLALLSQIVSGLYPDATEALAATKPSGEIHDLVLRSDAQWQSPSLSGTLQGLGLRQWQWVPGIGSLDGRFWLTPEQGALTLSLAKDRIDTGHHFKRPIAVDSFGGRLDWWRERGNWVLYGQDIALSNPDLSLATRFRLDLEARPFLALTGSVDVKNAAHADRYYPLQAMDKGLVDYLSAALQGGRAKGASLLWYGALQDFPYAGGEGIFQAAVPLEQARFQFDPGWQPLTDLQLDLLFQNASLDMQSASARLGKVRGERIHALIPDLAPDAHLYIAASVAGDGGEVTRYLNDSPLRDSVGQALEQVQVSGPLEGALRLDIPLNGTEVKVAGQAEFERSKVRLAALDLPLEEVRGILDFDNEKTGFKGVSARLYGNPVTLDYRGAVRPAGYRVDVGIKGEWDSSRSTLALPGSEVLKGKGRWSGKVGVDLNDARPLQFSVDLASDLQGMALDLPAPLTKAAGSVLPLRVTARGQNGKADIHAVLGSEHNLSARLDYGQSPARLTRLRANLGQPGTRVIRDAPLLLTISQNQADVGAWLSRLSGWLPARGGDGASLEGPAFWPSPWWVDGRINQARIGSATLKAVQFTVGAVEGATEVMIDSPQVLGVVRVPTRRSRPVEAQFGRLHWSGSSEDFRGTPDLGADQTLLAQLPWLTFTCADCRFGELPLGQVSGELKPAPGRVNLDRFKMELAGSTLSGKGVWRSDGTRMQTRLEGRLKSANSELLLRRFGYVSPLGDTPADVEFSGGWQDVPWRPQLTTLGGDAKVHLDGGTIREVNDRGARLLSFLSFDSLVRKLKLDFRDVFDKGFYFESITATLKARQGVIENRDLYMKGAAGNLRGEGVADLVRWNLDYQLSFSPNLGGTLPVVAAFSVTPVTGLYVFALSKLLEPVVDVVTRIDFRVEGPLDNPQLTEAGRDKARIKLNEEQRKEAEAATKPPIRP